MLVGFGEREGNPIFKRQRLGWLVQKYCSSHRISDFNPGLTMQKLNGSSRPAGQLYVLTKLNWDGLGVRREMDGRC